MRAQRIFLGVREAVAVRIAGGSVAAAAASGIEAAFHLPAVRQSVMVGVGVGTGRTTPVLVHVVQPVPIRVRKDRGRPVVVFDVVGTPIAVRVGIARRRPDLVLKQI